ncbi:hypothetical protein [Nocardia abscessus]|uniref:hypothetical protein n=1 Tax=Nocardia abscessus TaxID=120957 RepID=UPI00245550F2|nr:hypothetical protein [Nocardia abscessus]
MPDFDELLQDRQRLRDAHERAANGLAAAQAQQKRLARQLTQLARVFQRDNAQHRAERERLQQAQADAAAELRRQQQIRDAATAQMTALLEELAQFTDPRQAIERMKDTVPILMMPVRLETRFKTVELSGRPPVQQLWVRIYPDDCSIDSFHPVLTETEIRNAMTYWAGVWQAGYDDERAEREGPETQKRQKDQERGAWAGLVTAHGSGRAAWITQQFRPANMDDKPPKADANDVILTIATQQPLNEDETRLIMAFWVAMWSADGDATSTAAARTALARGVGAARAAELVEQYVPVNFDAPLAPGLTKTDVSVSAAIVVLPVKETKLSAWSQAPKTALLPDRFVFIGYESTDDTAPVVRVGQPVHSPLVVAPDPSAPIEQQLRPDANGNLLVPEELRWLSDFDRAVEVGMGLRVDLTPQQAAAGFHRVLVLGLRVTEDEQAARRELEKLIEHHSFSGSGIAVVPQGTPTNNTETVGAGHGRLDDPDRSFDDLEAPTFATTTVTTEKQDGQWLAEYLGVDPSVFAHTHAAGVTDHRCARAMNTALWPATLGYWMETMMSLVFSFADIERTRDFFTRFVIAGGPVPAIRIGRQPYGILPTTTISRMGWLSQGGVADFFAYERRLYKVLLGIEEKIRQFEPSLSFVGKQGDPHALLLDIVGLHPGSVEWSQRWAEHIATLENRLKLTGTVDPLEWERNVKRGAARIWLGDLGYTGEFAPPILDLVYSSEDLAMKGGVVDDQPLSEKAPIRAWTDGGQNYLQWLFDASGASLDVLYKQDGFKDDKPPHVLLYLWLRHALQLGYHDVSVKLHETAGLYTAQQAAQARQDDPFLHIREDRQVSESRYQPLYVRERSITGDAESPVHRFIATNMDALEAASYLRQQRDALQLLKDEPTARLERTFADHLDCCAYRLDAWFLGLVNLQLANMRNLREDAGSQARTGIHLGAYAWVEDLTPEKKTLEPVTLDEDLIEYFGGDPPLRRDSSNQGYVHAPSLNHAVAAAVLRNGFISNASEDNPRTMAVNLTSERVRTALAMLEGIRGGQNLSELLGYQLERGLHDSHSRAEIDKFLYKLRKAFPLRADRLNSTKTPEAVPIETIEARNVVNGLALVEHIKATDNKLYPFGKSPDLLPPTDTPAQADAINAEVDRLLDTHDAVADLALSEGVYQAVLGNYDRVASTYDAYARGNFPPEPDVVRTPLNGLGLTHRVGLHLEAGADPAVSPIGGVPTPRALGEPALNRWLAATLPPPNQVGCIVEFRRASTGLADRQEITLGDLGLEPADWLALLHDGNQQAMTELDDRILRHAVRNLDPRPDVPVTIRYMEKIEAECSIFELMPLMRNLRTLITTARPLQATDFTLTSEASSRHDSQPFAHKDRLERVRTAMSTARNDLTTFIASFAPLLADIENRQPDIIATVDDTIDTGATLLAQAASFAIPAAGWGFVYDMRRRTYAAILAQCETVVTRWDEKIARYTTKLADADAATTDAERFALLAQAELEITTVPTLPPPATPGLYRTLLVDVTQPAFEAKKAEFDAVRSSTLTRLSDLLTHVKSLLPINAFDAAGFDLTAQEDEIVHFTQDMAELAESVLAELNVRLAKSQALFDEHDDSAAPAARVRTLDKAAKSLLGADFRIIPEFELTTTQGDEVVNALTASRSGQLFQYLTNPPETDRDPLDFPVDTWLYGIARVRERMHAWEQVVTYAGAFGKPEPALDALQLPFAEDDRWLGLEFPPEKKPDTERLLYTAHFTAHFDKTAHQCGLLLDEWTETIPAPTVDTGITFHHDRPNTEATQSMLLVTPSVFRGTWRWNDLVDALNETLDLAKRRAIEPRHVDASPFAMFAPATVIATQASQLTIALDLGLNNKITKVE